MTETCEYCGEGEPSGLNEPFPVFVPGGENHHGPDGDLALCDRCCLAARVLAYTREDAPFVDIGLYQETTFYARQLAAIVMNGDPTEAVNTND